MSLLAALNLNTLKRSDPAATVASAATGASGAPVSEEVGYGDAAVGVKTSTEGKTLTVKWEHKQNVAGENFKVWIVPCYVKADVAIGIEGEIDLADAGKRTLKVKVSGAASLSIMGFTSKVATAGPRGVLTLSASTAIPVTLKQAKEFVAEPFVADVGADGKVGLAVEIEKGPSRSIDAELANFPQLYVVHVAGYSNGRFGVVRIEEGKDMQRLKASLQHAARAMDEWIEKHAPESVKDAAEQAARNVIDPGGETGKETTARVQKENAAISASYETFHDAMQASGLRDVYRKYCTAEECNAILDAFEKEQKSLPWDRHEAWRSMIAALVAKCKDTKARLDAEAAARARFDKEQGLAKAAELTARVRAAELKMNAALTAANNVGIPLEAKTRALPSSKARKYWESGMRKFWSPGSTARINAQGLQGEAKIAKAEEAAALLLKARTVFQEATRLTE